MSDLAQLHETGTGGLHLERARRLAAEALGTGLLIVSVIGSGVMASRLSPSDVGIQLLENAAATAAALIGLILIFGAVSGAHINPVVTLVDRAFGTTSTTEAALYIAAQVVGGCLGGNAREPPVRLADRRAAHQNPIVRRVVAVRIGCHRHVVAHHSRLRPNRRANVVAFAVGIWIGGAYWFTSSTSFANPAVTIARTLSDTFAGIKPAFAPMFIVVQLIGAVIAYGLIRLFYRTNVNARTCAMTQRARTGAPLPERRSISCPISPT